MCHDWPVKNAIVNLQISVIENSKRTSGNSLGPNLLNLYVDVGLQG